MQLLMPRYCSAVCPQLCVIYRRLSIDVVTASLGKTPSKTIRKESSAASRAARGFPGHLPSKTLPPCVPSPAAASPSANLACLSAAGASAADGRTVGRVSWW